MNTTTQTRRKPMEPTTQDRILGGLLGVAAGDALGATTEFKTPKQATRYGLHTEITGGGVFGWRPGQGTDDTDLTDAVLGAYLDPGGYSLKGVAGRMLSWLGLNPRDIGGTTSAALNRLKDSKNPATSGSTGESSQGNGSLMRCIPTALCRDDAYQRRTEMREISAITHAHPVCQEACVAYGEIIQALIENTTPTEAIGRSIQTSGHDQVTQALTIAAETPIEQLDTSGYVLAGLQIAAWAIQQPGTVEDTLIDIINRGGDADTNGAIAGGLLGVAHGASAIPDRWIRRLEYEQRFTDAAFQITALYR